MPAQPLAAHADAALVIAERELQDLLIEVDSLWAMWPKGKNAVERARIGQRIDDVLVRVSELYGVITTAQPETLQGAAVQLRRALALIDGDGKTAQRMIISALNVVDAPMDAVAPTSR